MKVKDVDGYLTKIWNEMNMSVQVVEENFWDICRILEKEGFLVSDDAAISTISVGPFKIASTVDIKKKDLLIYFLETIVPIIFSKINSLSFDQVYSLCLLPAFNILINLANNCYWIKDILQWEILMYIKRENLHGIYPTVNDIKRLDEFAGFGEREIDDAVRQLKNIENVLGDSHKLIIMDYEGRIECLV